MKKLLVIFAVLLLAPLSSRADNTQLFSRVDNSKASSMRNQYKEVAAPEFFNVNKDAVRSIVNSNSKFLEISIPVTDNSSVNLKLTEYDVLSPDAVIMNESSAGRITYPANVPFKAFKGYYNNDVNSLVILCFSETFVKGLMITDNNTYTISSLADATLSDEVILYANNKVLAQNDFKCAADMLTSYDEQKKNMEDFNPSRSVTSTFLQANIALEIDYYTYQLYGNSIPNASAYALSIMAVSSALYNRDVNVKIVVPSIHCWTTADPYTGAGSNDLLDQFRAWWNSNMTATPRTLAHFITRRPGGLGGIAWVNVLCANQSSGNGYGFSNTTGFIGQLPVYSWDVMVVSHEMGHNFGSDHTHGCSWPGGPIDTCYIAPENQSCLGGQQVRPVPGTIMSYCHLTSAGIDLKLGFGPLPKARIRQRAEVAGCMTLAPDNLLLSFPQGGETFFTNSQQYIYWGTSSESNLNIDLSTNSGSSWTSLATNVPAQNHYYVWTVPYIATSANCKIRVYDPTVPSFSDTNTTNFTIKVQLTPVNLIAPVSQIRIVTSSSDTSKITFSWTSSGSIPGINYKWKFRKSGNFTVFPSDSNGTAPRMTVRISKLDSLVRSFGLTGDSIICVWAAGSFLQSDSITSGSNVLIIKSATVGINNITTYVPTVHKLYSNYPNPFNPTTKIKFELPKDEFVRISIYDISGKEISTLVNQQMKLGVYEADFDGANLASGTYFYRIEMGGFVETRRMVLLK